jgi:hypothetical protein
MLNSRRRLPPMAPLITPSSRSRSSCLANESGSSSTAAAAAVVVVVDVDNAIDVDVVVADGGVIDDGVRADCDSDDDGIATAGAASLVDDASDATSPTKARVNNKYNTTSRGEART